MYYCSHTLDNCPKLSPNLSKKIIQKISKLLKKILQRRDDYFMIPQVTLVQKISSEDVPSPSCNGAQKSICCTLSRILITAASMTQGENYGRNIRLFAKNLYPLSTQFNPYANVFSTHS